MLALEEKCRGQSGFLCEGQAFFVESVLWIVYDFKAWSEGTVRDIIGIHNNEDENAVLEEQLVRAIGAQLLEPLDYLHTQVGRIFRDLRCKNLMVTSEGIVQLQIFTLPSILQEKAPIYKDSLLWASPELLLQERVPGTSMTSSASFNALSASVGPPVDVWALGMTLLELALGDPPFSPDLNPSQIFQTIVEGDAPTLPVDTSHLWSKGFKEVLAMCLTKDASQRATIADLKAHPFFAGAPGPEFIVQHLLAPLPPVESRWKLISQIRESQEVASKERQAQLAAQQHLQLSAQIHAHIPSGASSAIGTPQMSHSHSASSNLGNGNASTASNASNMANASSNIATSPNVTSPLQSPPHTSMLSSVSQPPLGEHYRGDHLPSSPTHSSPQFSLSTPEMPSFEAPGMGPSLGGLSAGVGATAANGNVGNGSVGNGSNGNGSIGNGAMTSNGNVGVVGSSNSAPAGIPSSTSGPSLNLASLNIPNNLGSGPSLDGGANGMMDSSTNGSSVNSSLNSSANGTGYTPRSAAQTPTPQQQQGAVGGGPSINGASSGSNGSSGAPVDNPFLFDPAYASKHGSGANTPVGQGTPRGHGSNGSNTANNSNNGNMVSSASSSSVPNGSSEPTRGRFRIVNPSSAAAAAAAAVGPSSSSSSMSSAADASVASGAGYTVTGETPHFQLPAMPNGSYNQQNVGSPTPIYGNHAYPTHQAPHMRRNSKGSHLMGASGYASASSSSMGQIASAVGVGAPVPGGLASQHSAAALHHASVSPSLHPLQTPSTNVPIEAFLGENDRDYFVVFRAIPGTMVSVTLEGRTLIISGQIPPLPVSVLKYIQSIDRPASKFERRIPFPGEIDSTDVGKEIIRESNLMVIRVKKCPKSIHIGDDMF